MTRAALAALLIATGCGRRAPIASCDDDLQGVYVSGASTGAAGAERWMVLDQGTALQAYPLFADPAPPGDATEVGPRLIDLARPAQTGTLVRRYLQRAARCDAHVPVRLTRCAGATLELVLGDPAPPLGFAPCTWPRPAPSRVVRWTRE